MSSRPNTPRLSSTSQQRVGMGAGTDPRGRRNAARGLTATDVAAPMTVDRAGRATIQTGRYLTITPDGKLDLNITALRSDGLLPAP